MHYISLSLGVLSLMAGTYLVLRQLKALYQGRQDNLGWDVRWLSAGVGLILIGAYLTTRAEDERYILPNGLTGPAIVIYNQSNGTFKRYDNAVRVYEIPKSGVLRTRFKVQEASRQIEYITQDGNVLRYLWPSDPVWKDTGNVNSVYKDSIYVYKATSNGDFIVGRPKQLDSLFKLLLRKRNAL